VGPQVRLLIEDADAKVPDPLRPLLAAVCDQIDLSGQQIKLAERQLEALAEQTPLVARLRTIPGIGPIAGTALPAFVGDVQRFPSARHFASYLGLTPSERSSGTKRSLGSISKRRCLLTHAPHPWCPLRDLSRQEGEVPRWPSLLTGGVQIGLVIWLGLWAIDRARTWQTFWKRRSLVH
jgi:transposase